MLGFVGAPFTLATYIVEGGSSKNFAAIKRLAFGEPAVLHALLDKLADNVADYVRYQVCVCYAYDKRHQQRRILRDCGCHKEMCVQQAESDGG